MLNIQSINHEGALLFLDEDDLAFMVASLDQRDAFTKKVWKILTVVQNARELRERQLSQLPGLQILLVPRDERSES